MRRGLGALACVVVPCLLTSACIYGDVWYHYDIVNQCGADLEVTFDVTGYYQKHVDTEPDGAAIVPDGGEGTIGMMSGQDLVVVAREHGGPWAAAGEVSSKELRSGKPLTISGDHCPPAAPDPHRSDPLLATYPFLDGAGAISWLSYSDSEDDTPETEGPVTARLALVVTGGQEWFDAFVAQGSDWTQAKLPSLPDVVAADVPPGVWEGSRAVGSIVKAHTTAIFMHVYVNRAARAVVVRTGPQP